MIGFLRGLVLESSSESCILCAAGVGYQVSIPDSTYRALPMQSDAEVSLWIHTVWREQTGPQLYGFASRAERQLFETLLDLNGVGPKTALAIVGHLPPDQLISAVQTGNLLPFTKVPGIGKKTAERLLVELKGKLEHLSPSTQAVQPHLPLVGDAIRALMHLGYSQLAAERAVRAAAEGESEDLGRLITSALQRVGAPA
jgi:Holliday junction DNA helicase RuvA